MKSFFTRIPTMGDLIELKARKHKGDLVPVRVALGLILLATGFGLYTAKQELAHAPNVFVDKRKRMTIPEVEMPDWAASEAEKYMKRSIFRKVAQVQNFDRVRSGVDDPTRPVNRPQRVESLKSVGVEPTPLPRLHL